MVLVRGLAWRVLVAGGVGVEGLGALGGVLVAGGVGAESVGALGGIVISQSGAGVHHVLQGLIANGGVVTGRGGGVSRLVADVGGVEAALSVKVGRGLVAQGEVSRGGA